MIHRDKLEQDMHTASIGLSFVHKKTCPLHHHYYHHHRHSNDINNNNSDNNSIHNSGSNNNSNSMDDNHKDLYSMYQNRMENVDTFLFGTKFWNVVTDALRIVRNQWCTENQWLGMHLLCALCHVLPCILCRQSYRIYYDAIQHTLNMDTDLLDVWYSIHHQVNRKIGVVRDNHSSKSTIHAEPGIVLTRKKFYKRNMVWTCFSSEQDVWDLLFMTAVAYPDWDTLVHQCLPEKKDSTPVHEFASDTYIKPVTQDNTKQSVFFVPKHQDMMPFLIHHLFDISAYDNHDDLQSKKQDSSCYNPSNCALFRYLSRAPFYKLDDDTATVSISVKQIQDKLRDISIRQVAHCALVYIFARLFAQEAHHYIVSEALIHQFNMHPLWFPIRTRDEFFQWVFNAYTHWCKKKNELLPPHLYLVPQLNQCKAKYQFCKP